MTALVSWSSQHVTRGAFVMGATHVKSNRREALRLHPLPVRIMHRINAAVMIIMIMSGWGEAP